MFGAETKSGIITFTACISPNIPIADIDNSARTHFAYMKCDKHYPAIVVSGSNVDASQPDKKWFIQFMLEEFVLEVAGIPSMEPSLILVQSPTSVCCLSGCAPGAVFVDGRTVTKSPAILTVFYTASL